MYRALFELIITVLIILVARSLLTSLLKGVSSAAKTFQNEGPRQQEQTKNQASSSTANELHKDPVCGTYVAESTPFQRKLTGQVFYYCSTDCREKHALVAR